MTNKTKTFKRLVAREGILIIGLLFVPYLVEAVESQSVVQKELFTQYDVAASDELPTDNEFDEILNLIDPLIISYKDAIREQGGGGLIRGFVGKALAGIRFKGTDHIRDYYRVRRLTAIKLTNRYYGGDEYYLKHTLESLPTLSDPPSYFVSIMDVKIYSLYVMGKDEGDILSVQQAQQLFAARLRKLGESSLEIDK